MDSEVIIEGVDFSKIYYPDTEDTYLYSEVKPINRPNIEEAIIKVFDELKAGPQQERLKKIISENVKVLSVKVEENICTVDLSQEFIDENTDNSTMRLYSVVNSICALPVVDSVKINIEGNESAVLGEYSLKDVLEENLVEEVSFENVVPEQFVVDEVVNGFQPPCFDCCFHHIKNIN